MLYATKTYYLFKNGDNDILRTLFLRSSACESAANQNKNIVLCYTASDWLLFLAAGDDVIVSAALSARVSAAISVRAS